ncbi:zinc finger protein hangover-like [Amblyomma americanum]
MGHCKRRLPGKMGKIPKSGSALRLDAEDLALLSPHRCPLCGRCYKRRRQMVAHLRKAHKQPESLRCSRCGCQFASSGSLSAHRTRIHGDDRSRRRRWKNEPTNRPP